MARKTTKTKASANTEPDATPAKCLYSVTYSEDSAAPAELNLGLPGGGSVFVRKHHDGKIGDPGYPYAEVKLTEDEAKQWARHYELHGFTLQKIEVSARAPHPLAKPQS